MESKHKNKVAFIIGCGEGIGGKTAKKFAKEGYITVIARRNKDKLQNLVNEITQAGGKAIPYGIDATNEEQVVKAVDSIEKDIGQIEMALFNCSALVMKDLVDTTLKEFTNQYNVTTLAGFIFGKAVAKVMIPRGYGTILFTGATASTRAKKGCAGFGSSKMALRGIYQGFAKELGPKGIHIGHLIVDGMVTGPKILEYLGEEKYKQLTPRLIPAESIAETYWFLHNQKKSCWTNELDVRTNICDW